MVALEADRVRLSYGQIHAVDGVSLTVPRGDRLGLIGPNGAGKSTLLGLLSGRKRATSGTIRFDGSDVTRRPVHLRARVGVVQTFQTASLFDKLSVLDNVRLAVQRRMSVAASPWPRRSVSRRIDQEALEVLDLVGVACKGSSVARELSHGDRRQLEVAVSLASRPAVLLLDEPSAGMSQSETRGFVEMILRLPAEMSLVIVEHDLDVVFELSTRLAVLDAGRLIACGAPDEVRALPSVRAAYLGEPNEP